MLFRSADVARGKERSRDTSSPPPPASAAGAKPLSVSRQTGARMFWIVAAAMMAVVAAAIALPFLRGGAAARPAAAFDLQVYRDQLREVDRDRGRGVLTDDDAERLRTEIGRKVLDADRALAGEGPASAGGRGNAGALVLLAAAVLGSAALYALTLGAPARPDDPLAARLAAAAARYDSRPTQAEAEAAAPAQQAPPADPGYLKLVDQLRATVAERPDDVQGLALLAQHEATLGNLVAARTAQQRLVAVRGDQATAAARSRRVTSTHPGGDGRAAGGRRWPGAPSPGVPSAQRCWHWG